MHIPVLGMGKVEQNPSYIGMLITFLLQTGPYDFPMTPKAVSTPTYQGAYHPLCYLRLFTVPAAGHTGREAT